MITAKEARKEVLGYYEDLIIEEARAGGCIITVKYHTTLIDELLSLGYTVSIISNEDQMTISW